MSDAIVDTARRLQALIGAAGAEIEQARRLPESLVAALCDAGLFRLCVPAAYGGGEVAPAVLVAAIEAIAEADGSAGWCVMIGATTGLTSAYLDPAVARTVYGSSRRTITGGVFAPSGTAREVDGGYRVDGRWSFASGSQHCDWLMGGCTMTTADGAPQKLAPRMMLFPADAAKIHDTWDVSGLRGTGSHDISVSDLFVPAAHSVSLVSDAPKVDAVLYRFPVFGLLALGIAAVALGIARRAIDELSRLATVKTPTASRRKLADRPMVQYQVAEAEAGWRAARALLYASIDAASRRAADGADLPLETRADLRLAASYATAACARAVDLMYHAGGGTSVYASSPLQRCFRDIHVATQHIMVAPPTLEVVGRVLLGIETQVAEI